MLLTITSTTAPATDLGYLLHKNPARVQTFALTFGEAHVFYPEASKARCTAALLLDIDPVRLVRGKQDATQPYVNDRPYVASSFLSVAISEVYRNALSGSSKERPELAETALPFSATVSVLSCPGGDDLLARLFEPLGYTVSAIREPLDTKFSEWGESEYVTLTIANTLRLRDLLAHLYVLIPVLDSEKHYFLGDDEVDKLLRHGAGWLPNHPERALIAKRYLKRRRLVSAALAQLLVSDDAETVEATAPEAETADTEPADAATDKNATDAAEPVSSTGTGRRVSLHDERLAAAMVAIRESGAKSVLDLGCGEGRLLSLLLAERGVAKIVGMDASFRSLQVASDRLHLERMPPMQRERIELIHGALTYRDRRLAGFDAAAIVEVIEHLDLARLAAFERVVFEAARPGTVIVTTPNAEYNVRFPTLAAGTMRHADHRFEWSRIEFESWAKQVCERFGYRARFSPIGPEDPDVGAPSQMAVFERA